MADTRLTRDISPSAYQISPDTYPIHRLKTRLGVGSTSAA